MWPIHRKQTYRARKNFLRQAFKESEPYDTVIEPGSNGGYYLIGFSRKSLPIFIS
ncbi:MAG: DUF2064 domain-containing protein [Planctomycetota bacterium]